MSVEERKVEEAMNRCMVISDPDRKKRCEELAKYTWQLGLEHEFFLVGLSDDIATVVSNPMQYNDRLLPHIGDLDFAESIGGSRPGWFIEDATCKFIDESIGHSEYSHGARTIELHPIYKKAVEDLARKIHGVPYSELDNGEKWNIRQRLKSDCRYNRKVEDITDELIEIDEYAVHRALTGEERAAEQIREGAADEKSVMVWPFGGISKVRTIRDDDTSYTVPKNYGGSYHISITLPHEPDDSENEMFERRNEWLKAVQWLEPLFVSTYFGPDVESFGDLGKHVEGSYRLKATKWGNLGDVKIGEGGEGEVDEEALSDYCTSYADNQLENYIDVSNEAYDLAKESVGDDLRSECIVEQRDECEGHINRGDFATDDEYNEAIDECVEENESSIDDCTDAAIHYSDAYGEILSELESDARDREYEYCMEEQVFGEVETLDTGGLTEERTEFRARRGGGVEIRIWDNFPTGEMKNVLKELVLVAAMSEERDYIEDMNDRGENRKIWDKAIERVRKEGYNAQLPDEYINALREKMGLHILTNSNRAKEVFHTVVQELWSRYHDHDWYQVMVEKPNEPIRTQNINEVAYDYHSRQKLRESPEDVAKFKRYLKNLRFLSNLKECERRPCWIPLSKDRPSVEENQPETEQTTISCAEMDETEKPVTDKDDFVSLMQRTLGPDYTKEDIRDVIDMLDRRNIIAVVRSPKGLIQEVRPLYNMSDVNLIVDNMVKDRAFNIKPNQWKEVR